MSLFQVPFELGLIFWLPFWNLKVQWLLFLSAAITPSVTVLSDFNHFHASSGSPLELALFDSLHLRGPDTSREAEVAADLHAMKFRMDCVVLVYKLA